MFLSCVKLSLIFSSLFITLYQMFRPKHQRSLPAGSQSTVRSKSDTASSPANASGKSKSSSRTCTSSTTSRLRGNKRTPGTGMHKSSLPALGGGGPGNNSSTPSPSQHKKKVGGGGVFGKEHRSKSKALPSINSFHGSSNSVKPPSTTAPDTHASTTDPFGKRKAGTTSR